MARHPRMKHTKPKKSMKQALLRTSLLAASLTSGLTGSLHAASAYPSEPPAVQQPYAPQPSVADSAQPTVYQGDSLLYFQNLLSFYEESNQLTDGESAGPLPSGYQLLVHSHTPKIGRLSTQDELSETNDGLSYEIVSEPDQGELLLTNADTGSYVYTPSDTDAYTTTFTYRVVSDSYQSEPASITITVAESADQTAVRQDLEQLEIGFAPGDTKSSVTQTLSLPTSGPNGTQITWTSGDLLHVSDTGAVLRPSGDDLLIELTAVVRKNGYSRSQIFSLIVKAAEESVTDTSGAVSGTPAAPQADNRLDGANDRSSEKLPSLARVVSDNRSDGSRTAAIQLLTEPVQAALSRAKPGDTISLDATSITSDVVQVAIPGETLQAFFSKKATLSLRTAEATVQLPTSAVSLNQSGEAAELRMELGKAPVPAAFSALSPDAKVVGSPYALRLTATVNGQETPVAGYDYRYAALTIPYGTADAAKPDRTAAVLLTEDGRMVPVPMRLNADGSARISTTQNGTLLLVEQPAAVLDGTQPGWAEDAFSRLGGRMLLPDDVGYLSRADAKVTRAEFANLLMRALGADVSGSGQAGSAFKDIGSQTPYADSIRAAVAAGLFKGVADDRFAPDAVITREQMAAILVRAAKQYGLQLTSPDSAPGADAGEQPTQPAQSAAAYDYSDVSRWAFDEVREAVQLGLMQGVGGGKLAAAEQGTHSHGAVMLYQLLVRAGLIN